MLFISAEDFLSKANNIPRIGRDEEKSLALRMKNGDKEARQMLIHSYLPSVAFHVRRVPQSVRTLHTVYACIGSLERAIDKFNFFQDSESFTHHLSRYLRQCITDCIADRP
jgi:RNA polymerase primary sigma factor